MLKMIMVAMAVGAAGQVQAAEGAYVEMFEYQLARAQKCVIAAADDLAARSTESADVIATAAVSKCSKQFQNARETAALAEPNLDEAEHDRGLREFEAKVTKRTVQRVVERRAGAKQQ